MVVLPHISIPWHDGITHPHPVCRVQHTRDVGCAVATGVQVISEKNKTAIAFIHDDQLSLAIGKEGQNARLAAKLTGWKIGIESTEAHAKKVAAEGK